MRRPDAIAPGKADDNATEEAKKMGIGISVVLLAAGAILSWGVSGDVSGVNLDVVGVILMIVGAIGLLWALVASSAMPWRRDTVVERDVR